MLNERALRDPPRRSGRPAILGLACAAALLAGCDDVLEVRDPDVVTPDVLEDPDAIPLVINGVTGDFQEALDDFVRYTALFTDEMILAGTFPTRIDVDERMVQRDPDNTTLTTDLYEPLHVARASADRGAAEFEEALADPEFADFEDALAEGIALSHLYGGYARLFFAELYCGAVLEENGPVVSSDQAAEAAVERFQAARAAAQNAGLGDVETAALIGEARALAWLAQLDQAAMTVASVATDFVFYGEYSANVNDQWNEMFAFAWGRSPFTLRWTVGDGTAGNRHNERWPYFEEWLDQGLLVDDPDGFEAVEIGIPIALQLVYDVSSRPVVLASGWEARMIQAEAMLRAGDAEGAQDLVNGLLSDPSANPMTQVNPDLELGAFEPVSFTGDPANDLAQLAGARAAGLWLTGERQATLRRFAERDGIDLYPAGTQGNDTSFPIVQQEIDNNPNVGSACSAGVGD